MQLAAGQLCCPSDPWRLGIYLSHTPTMGAQADTPMFVYTWIAVQSRSTELCSSYKVLQKQAVSLWEAKPQGYVRPWFLFQSHEQTKKFCSCHPLPGLCMVPCTEAAWDLAAFVLSRASSALVVCLFQRCFLLHPTMSFVLHRKLWTGRILSPIHRIRES